MPPKFDPSQVVDVFVRVTGGEVGTTSSLAPKIGPLRLSPKKIGKDIAKEIAKTGRVSTWRWSSPFRTARRRWQCCPPSPCLSLKRSKSPRGTLSFYKFLIEILHEICVRYLYYSRNSYIFLIFMFVLSIWCCKIKEYFDLMKFLHISYSFKWTR